VPFFIVFRIERHGNLHLKIANKHNLQNRGGKR
jgi:hypothetical protein